MASYKIEPRDVQMKIMRTHLAALTGEVSNLRTMMEVEFSKAQERAAMLQKISEQIEDVRHGR